MPFDDNDNALKAAAEGSTWRCSEKGEEAVVADTAATPDEEEGDGPVVDVEDRRRILVLRCSNTAATPTAMTVATPVDADAITEGGRDESELLPFDDDDDALKAAAEGSIWHCSCFIVSRKLFVTTYYFFLFY